MLVHSLDMTSWNIVEANTSFFELFPSTSFSCAKIILYMLYSSKLERWTLTSRFDAIIILSENSQKLKHQVYRVNWRTFPGDIQNFSALRFLQLFCASESAISRHKWSRVSMVVEFGCDFNSLLLWILIHETLCSTQLVLTLSCSLLAAAESKILFSASDMHRFVTGASSGMDFTKANLLLFNVTFTLLLHVTKLSLCMHAWACMLLRTFYLIMMSRRWCDICHEISISFNRNVIRDKIIIFLPLRKSIRLTVVVL